MQCTQVGKESYTDILNIKNDNIYVFQLCCRWLSVITV